MSLSELAHARDLSRRTLQRHMAELKRLGYVRIQHRPGKPSIYRLTTRGLRFTSRKTPRRVTGLIRRIWGRVSGEQAETPLPAEDNTAPITRAVGRQKILDTLHENVARGQHTLLVGPLGIGKSHILRQFTTRLGPEFGEEPPPSASTPTSAAPDVSVPLYLEHISPVKPALVTLAERLHAHGRLEVTGIEARYMEWEDVRKKISPLRVHQLAKLVTACMEDRNYVLIMDHLERVTPTMLPHLNALMEVTTVIAAADELKPSAQRLWWAFERIEVPPLSQEHARDLLWQVADRDRVAQPQLFQTRVLQQAGGNPLAIITMAGKARSTQLSPQEIRSLHHGAGIRYIPLTPILMVIGALIMAARFVALGLNDRDLYVLAGLGYAFFFVMRYFIYRVD